MNKKKQTIDDYLEIPKRQKILFLISIFLIALGYVLSPIFMRMIIDGVVTTKDFNALIITTVILFITEIVSISTNYQFDLALKEEALKAEQDIKDLFVSKTIQNRNSITKSKFHKVKDRTIKNIVNHFFVQKWFLYKNIFVVWMLFIAALIIDYNAMFALLALMLINIASQFYLNSKSKKNKQEYDLIDLYEDNLSTVFNSKDKYIDQGLQDNISGEIDLLSEQVNKMEFKQNNIKVNSFHLAQTIRPFGIILVLLIGSWGYMTNQSSLGAIWALLLVIFRILGPIRSIINWQMMKGNFHFQYKEIKNIIESNLEYHFEKSGFHNKLIRFLEKNIKTNTFFVINHKLNYSELTDALRFWQKNFPQKIGIFTSEHINSELLSTAANYDFIICLFNSRSTLPSPEVTSKLLELKGYFFCYKSINLNLSSKIKVENFEENKIISK